VRDGFTPNLNGGLLIEPVEQVSIGLAIQPPTTFRARGQAVLDFTGSGLEAAVDRSVYQDGGCTIGPADPACANEDGIELEIGLPLVLRAGIAVRPRPNVEIEAAVVWQNWKVLEDIILRDVDPPITAFGAPADLPPEFPLPAGLRNTASWRLGAEWRVDDMIALRAGGFYENGALSNERLSVSLVDPWKVQVGGGWSLWPVDGRIRIDGAVAGIFFPALDLRESKVEQIFVDVLDTGNTPATVGNGDLRSSGWIVGLQASWILRRSE
jgi:long-subunit fatty acid transport protein